MPLAVLAQAAPAAQSPSSAELVVFLIIGALSLGSAVSMVALRNPVHAALMLVLNFFTIAVFYAVLEAQFLATVQIIVYAGAIMVLFLFVIMLLGVDQPIAQRRERVRGQKAAGTVLGVVLFGALAISVGGPFLAKQSACPTPPPAEGQAAPEGTPCIGLAAPNDAGNTQALGNVLFTRYVWPFEVISILLVIAAIGAMVLGRRTEDPADLVDAGAPEPDPEPPAPEDTPAEPAVIGQGNPAPSSGVVEEDH
jgi:NADH-quinone oxidoreductase subunit J